MKSPLKWSVSRMEIHTLPFGHLETHLVKSPLKWSVSRMEIHTLPFLRLMCRCVDVLICLCTSLPNPAAMVAVTFRAAVGLRPLSLFTSVAGMLMLLLRLVTFSPLVVAESGSVGSRVPRWGLTISRKASSQVATSSFSTSFASP